MSSLFPNSEIKQELLDTLEKLIRHSSSEAQLLKETLQSYRLECLKSSDPPSATVVAQTSSDVKVELLPEERHREKDVSGPIPPLLRCSPPQPTTPTDSQLLSPALRDILPAQHTPPQLVSDDLVSGEKRLLPVPAEDTLHAAQTLLEINNRLSEQLKRVNQAEQPTQPAVVVPDQQQQPQSKRPRIDLGPHFPDPVPAAATSTPMVLVPIPADRIKDLLLNGGVIPPMSLLSAMPLPQLSELTSQLQQPSSDLQRTPATPILTTTSPPVSPPAVLSPTMSSSILRFCERRARVDAVDVFHYLPADARASPFPVAKSGNYRNLLDDITSTKVKIPKLPKDFEAMPKLNSQLNERTVYTPYQTEKLESSFNSNTFLTKEGREALGKELNIHPGRIKVWYQNRRARMRREEMLKEKIRAAAAARTSEDQETADDGKDS